ncbi:MAG TPA: lamin tail domain-containing protein [Kofleriaceae bacterium]|nr:lamin tail domain-containing protein [Kofleriaceae bacterium]
MRLGAAFLVLAACGGGSPPQIHGLSDQVATVGSELVVMIDASDDSGERIDYGVHADISLQGTAMMTKTPAGMGVFRWTPLAEQIGTHTFDFTATDSNGTTTVTIQIDVRAAVGAAPIFRQPLGTGTVLNVAQTPCADVDILVEDQDSIMVTIAQEAPVIDGAQLTIVDGLSATWHWCPTAQQVAAQNRYTLVLSADDGDNPKTIKNYVLVLGSGTMPQSHLVINEVDYDNVGTDSAEYVELKNTGTASADLAGLRLALVNGATSQQYDSIDLSPAAMLGPGEYVVIAGAGVTVPPSAKKLDPVWSVDQIQNGAPDGLAIVDPVTHTVLDALSYEGAITAATLPDFANPVSLVEGTPLPASVADSNTQLRSLCRNPDGQDTNDAATDWTPCTTLTPGTANQP